MWKYKIQQVHQFLLVSSRGFGIIAHLVEWYQCFCLLFGSAVCLQNILSWLLTLITTVPPKCFVLNSCSLILQMRKSEWVGNFKIIYIILNFLVLYFLVLKITERECHKSNLVAIINDDRKKNKNFCVLTRICSYIINFSFLNQHSSSYSSTDAFTNIWKCNSLHQKRNFFGKNCRIVQIVVWG